MEELGVGLVDDGVCLEGIHFRTFRNMLPRRKVINGSCLIGLILSCSFSSTVGASSLRKALGCTRICRGMERRVTIPDGLLRRITNEVTRELFSSFPRVRGLRLSVAGIGPPVKTSDSNTKMRIMLAGSGACD